MTTPKPDEGNAPELEPVSGNFSRVVQSKTRGKRPFDNPKGEAKPRKMSKEDMERAPGLPEEEREALRLEAKARETRGNTPRAEHSDSTDARGIPSSGLPGGGTGGGGRST